MNFSTEMRVFVFSLVLALSACTGNLSHSRQFQDLIGRDLTLIEGTSSWVLVNNKKASITAHSNGNRLYLVPVAYTREKLESDSSGQSRFIAQGEGATIRLTRVLEYGMETWYPVALGEITLPDGKVLPFEAEWRDSFFVQVSPK